MRRVSIIGGRVSDLATTIAVAAAIALGSSMFVASTLEAKPRRVRDGNIIHRLKSGETFELLAAEYYGDRALALLIRAENGLTPQTPPLKVGTRIKIPVSRDIATEAGDTVASLAREFLADARRGPFLVGFNEPVHLPRGADTPLAAGIALRIPIHIHYKVGAQDTLEGMAQRFYGSSRKSALIREYNFLTEDQIAPSTILTIPLHHIEVSPSRRKGLDKGGRARIARRQEMQRLLDRGLPTATTAWRFGAYDTIIASLRDIDYRYVSVAMATEVAILLGSSHIAVGEEEAAKQVFTKLLARNPTHELNSYHVSPKVCDVWRQAGGTVIVDAPPESRDDL